MTIILRIIVKNGDNVSRISISMSLVKLCFNHLTTVSVLSSITVKTITERMVGASHLPSAHMAQQTRERLCLMLALKSSRSFERLVVMATNAASRPAQKKKATKTKAAIVRALFGIGFVVGQCLL